MSVESIHRKFIKHKIFLLCCVTHAKCLVSIFQLISNFTFDKYCLTIHHLQLGLQKKSRKSFYLNNKLKKNDNIRRYYFFCYHRPRKLSLITMIIKFKNRSEKLQSSILNFTMPRKKECVLNFTTQDPFFTLTPVESVESCHLATF